jgi:hypothetical protein
MKGQEEARCFSSEELDFLQGCFNKLLASNQLRRDSEEATAIAAALFEAFRRGVTDKRELMRLADIYTSKAA